MENDLHLELLDYLNENYYMPGHQLFSAGQNKIYTYFKGRLPKKKIVKWLSTDYAYSIHRNQANKKPKNPIFKHFKRYQFQVCTYLDE